MLRPGRSVVAGAILAALLSSLCLTVLTRVWDQPLHVPFQYTHTPTDDEQDATLDLMLIKNIHETGWFNENPKLNAPFEQQWAEWPMGGDLLAYTIKKAMVDTTGDVPLTFNLFWLLTFPLTALVAFPALRSLRCSWATSLVGAVLFSLTPYHFRNGAAHENLAFYVGIPVIVVLCAKVLGPDSALPSVAELRHRAAWWRMRWLLLGTVLVGVTGIYYLAFLLSLLAICAGVSALARRRPGRFVLAGLFGAVGLATSFVANLPTLLFRWSHAPNVLGVPDRKMGISESYPLRLVELLSPVTQHRFGPFAALADHLYEPGREGLGTAELGLAAAIGLVVAITVVLVRALHRSERGGWTLEARIGIIVMAALLIGTKGGLSRPLELVGLQGVRAWNRIAIVVAFACIVVFARLLDRVRVMIRRRHWPRPRLLFTSLLVVVLVGGVYDQASPALMPNSKAREKLWYSDGAFVAAIERRLPKNAMVFQLPVVDFPEHSAVANLSGNDLIKKGYLHSKTLRWSAGGVRGRTGEWQFPAAELPVRDLLRGVVAMGFTGLTLDRDGFTHSTQVYDDLVSVLGPPVVRDGFRMLFWDLRPATGSLLAGLSPAGRHALVQRMLDAPRIYYATDVDGIRSRGGTHDICASGTVTLVNPGSTSTPRALALDFHREQSTARNGDVTIAGRRFPITTDGGTQRFPVNVAPGTSTIKITVDTPGTRCASAPSNTLPTMSAGLETVTPGG